MEGGSYLYIHLYCCLNPDTNLGEGGMVMRCVVTMIKHSHQLFPEKFDEYLPKEIEVNQYVN